MFNLSETGYELNVQFDKLQLQTYLNSFCGVVCRRQDQSLATRLRQELLDRQPPSIERMTFQRLAKWCKTGGIFAEGMEPARQISRLLFGQVLNRDRLGF